MFEYGEMLTKKGSTALPVFNTGSVPTLKCPLDSNIFRRGKTRVKFDSKYA